MAHGGGSPTSTSLGEVKLLQQLRGHTSDVTSCDFAPNFTLITGSSDKSTRLWDWKGSEGLGYVQTPTQSPLLGHKYGVTCVRVSPQGAMLATTSLDGTAILWSLRPTYAKLYTFNQINSDSIRVCRFSPDSSLLFTGGHNGAICVWDLVHKSLIRNLFKHEGTVQALSVTVDNKLLISGCSNGVVYIWNVAQVIDTTLETQPSPIICLDDVHDLGVTGCDISKHTKIDENNPLIKIYTFATCGNDEVVKIWDISYETIEKKGQHSAKSYLAILRYELKGHESAVTTIKYNHSSNLIATSGLDKTIRLWAFVEDTWKCVKVLTSHSRYVNSVAFSRDGTFLASGSNDKSILIWCLSDSVTLSTELSRPSLLFSTARGSVQENDFVRNAQVQDNDVKLIEMIDDIAESSINCCRFFRSNTLATASADRLIKVFHFGEETNSLEELSTSPYEGHIYPVNYIDFNLDGSKLVSCSLDGTVVVWETQTGSQISHIPTNDMSVRVCKYSPNGAYLATAGDDEVVRLWDGSLFKNIKCLDGHTESVTCLSFTLDSSMLATVCNNGNIRIWSLPYGHCLFVEVDGHDLGAQGCDFSPGQSPIAGISDSHLLATCGNDSLIKLWILMRSTQSVVLKLWRNLEGHGGNVTSVKFSPHTGEIVASTATDRQCRLWSVYSAQCLHVLEHNAITTCCDFSDNTSMIAVGCLDKTLWLWKLPQTLVFQTLVANKIKSRRRAVIDWHIEDIANWLTEVGLVGLSQKIMSTTLNGQKLLTLSPEQICHRLDLSDVYLHQFTQELSWLKQDELSPKLLDDVYLQIPDEYLCPITRELMQWPVTCSDGFTYERQAITEWFLSGKYTSPMTNEDLPNTDFTLNKKLRQDIHKFLYEHN